MIEGEEEAKAEANEWISGKAALHDPDQKAGGYSENVTGLGDEGVNSSIGAQWNRKKNIKKMDENANCLKETLPPEELKSTTMVTILIIRS